MNRMYSAPWRKSSYSGGNGGGCIEVATWRTASYSTGNGGNCVEVAAWRTSSYTTGNGGACVEVGNSDAVIVVRDTKNRDGLTLAVPADAWRRFTATLR